MGRVRRGMKIELNKNKIKFDSKGKKRKEKKKAPKNPRSADSPVWGHPKGPWITSSEELSAWLYSGSIL